MANGRAGKWISRLVAGCIAATAVMSLAARAGFADAWDDTVKAAESEGVVTVVGPPIPFHRASIETFRAAYPKIRLDLSGLTPSEYEPKIAAERKASIYSWDVMVSGMGPSTYNVYIPQKWIVPIRDQIRPDIARDNLWLGGFDAGFLDKEKKFVFAMQGVFSSTNWINRAQIPESQLGDIADLLKPEWKGRIAMFDPRARGPGGTTAAQLLMAFGKEKGAAFLRNQAPVLTTTPRLLVEWTVRGNYPIAMGLPENDLVDYQKRGLGLDIKPLRVPKELQPVGPQWGAMVLFNNAPHPNAAKVFINWILSKDAQSDWSKRAASNSRRLDAERGDPKNVLDAEGWLKGLNFNSEALVPVREQALEMAQSALQ